MAKGVSITELYCPTCGAQYGLPLHIERELEEIYGELSPVPKTYVVPAVHWYITCSNRHKWSVKYVYRHTWPHWETPDQVLLGQYLGDI